MGSERPQNLRQCGRRRRPNGRDGDIGAAERREQEIVLRVGRILKFIDEHEGISHLKRTANVWTGPQQELREPIEADKAQGRLGLGSELTFPPTVNGELNAGLWCRAHYRQAVGTNIARLEIARAKAGDFGLPLRRSREAGEVEEACGLPVCRKRDLIGSGWPPIGGYSTLESIDQAFRESVESERCEAVR